MLICDSVPLFLCTPGACVRFLNISWQVLLILYTCTWWLLLWSVCLFSVCPFGCLPTKCNLALTSDLYKVQCSDLVCIFLRSSSFKWHLHWWPYDLDIVAPIYTAMGWELVFHNHVLFMYVFFSVQILNYCLHYIQMKYSSHTLQIQKYHEKIKF